MKKQFIFYTTHQGSYFENIKKILGHYGWEVFDDLKYDNPSQLEIPVLVYNDLTMDTVNTMKSMVLSQVVNPNLMCGLIDSHKGMQDI